MKITFLLLLLVFSYIHSVQAQVKFGAKSGIGVFFEFFDYNILAPKTGDAPKTSLYGNPVPGSKKTLYLGLSHQHEIFATYHNQIFKFAVAFSDANRPYNDLLEVFWGNKHEDRFIHYQLGYGLKLFDKKRYDMDIQSGLIAEKYFVTSTRYDIVKVDDKYYPVNPVIVTSGKDPNQFDWGFPVEINANYKISEYAAIGLQAKTSYILGLGIQWLYLMPMVKVQF